MFTTAPTAEKGVSTFATLCRIIFGDDIRWWTGRELLVVACRFVAELKHALVLGACMFYALQAARKAEDGHDCLTQVLPL